MRLVDGLIDHYFTYRSNIFHSHGVVSIASEELQHSGLCSVLVFYDSEGSLSCHTCYDTGPRFWGCQPRGGGAYSCRLERQARDTESYSNACPLGLEYP